MKKQLSSAALEGHKEMSPVFAWEGRHGFLGKGNNVDENVHNVLFHIFYIKTMGRYSLSKFKLKNKLKNKVIDFIQFYGITE